MRKFWFILSIILMIILCGCNSHSVITGTVYDEKDGSPLFQALITDRRSGETVVTDKEGAFSISVKEGDSIDISYVGMLPKTVAVNSKDSVHWNVGLKEYGPIIEPALQHSHSTYEGVSMSVQNLNELAIPVDSIVLSIKNDTDETVTFGEVYELFQKRDGQWQPMPYNREYEEGEIEHTGEITNWKEVYAAVRSDIDRNSTAYELFEFLTTPIGQKIIEESGYVPL